MATPSPLTTSSSRPGESYYPSPLHEEALARLAYLAEKGSACGLLLGPSGSGKSLILSRFAHQQRKHGVAVAAVNVSAATARELLLEIGTAWGANVRTSEELPLLWNKVSNRLRELDIEQVPALLLIDDLHLASTEGAAVVDRLHAYAESNEAGLLLIAACESRCQESLTTRLLSRAQLRVDLDWWNLEETAGFLQLWLAQNGGEGQEFDDQAIEVLHELAEGNPRRVRQLAELTLLAGSGEGERLLHEGVVQAAFEELCLGR
jgi:general secretion pathway protein A